MATHSPDPAICEHELIPENDLSEWHYSHLFALRVMLSAANLINQSADELVHEILLSDDVYLECIETLKVLQSDELAARRRADFARSARLALTQAIEARDDPRTAELMQREIDFAHVKALWSSCSGIANSIRVNSDDGRAYICWEC